MGQELKLFLGIVGPQINNWSRTIYNLQIYGAYGC